MGKPLIGAGLLMLLALAVAGSPPAAPAAVTPRIEWRATGGFAALDNRLVVYASGRVVLTYHSAPKPQGKSVSRKLSRAQHQRLLRIVRAAHIERLPSVYESRTPVADGIDQTLRFRGDTVTVRQESNPPKALERALDELSLLQNKLGNG